jgi:hypothetical protein
MVDTAEIEPGPWSQPKCRTARLKVPSLRNTP